MLYGCCGLLIKGLGIEVFSFFKTKYELFKETYYFPNTPIFENLKVSINKHLLKIKPGYIIYSENK